MLLARFRFQVVHGDRLTLARLKFIDADLQIAAEFFEPFNTQQYVAANLFACRVGKRTGFANSYF